MYAFDQSQLLLFSCAILGTGSTNLPVSQGLWMTDNMQMGWLTHIITKDIFTTLYWFLSDWESLKI